MLDLNQVKQTVKEQGVAALESLEASLQDREFTTEGVHDEESLYLDFKNQDASFRLRLTNLAGIHNVVSTFEGDSYMELIRIAGQDQPQKHVGHTRVSYQLHPDTGELQTDYQADIATAAAELLRQAQLTKPI